MAVRALSLLSLTSLCVVALSQFDAGSRFHSRPPYKPSLPFPHHDPQPQQQDDYYNNVNNNDPYYNEAHNQNNDYNNGHQYGQPNSDDTYDPAQHPYEQPNSFPNEQNRYNQPPGAQPDSNSFPNQQNRYDQPVNPPGTQPQPPSVPGSPELHECKIIERYVHSIPSGDPKDLQITPIQSLSAQECLTVCCDMGPSDCQYIWVFRSQCYAVACLPEASDMCKPRKVFDKDAADSGYYKVRHPEEHHLVADDEEEDEGTTSDTTPPTAIATTFGREGEGPTNQVNIEHSVDVDPEPKENDPTPQEGDPTSNAGFEPDSHPFSEEVVTPGPTAPGPTDQDVTEPVSVAVATDTTPTLRLPTPIEPPEHPLENLTIAIAGETDIVLPENEVTLFASSWPNPPGVRFHWTIVSGRNEGSLNGMNDPQLVLSELLPGVYGLRVTAESPSGQFGEKFVNVTVHEPPRQNTPPKAVVYPSTNYTVDLPQDTVIFDAGQSEDDLGPANLRYVWQQVAGPMGTGSGSEEALLTLSSPQPGNYRYKLTVTDSDGAQTVAFVDLKVVPEPDYAPLANAGNDVALKLPNSEVVLYGNSSSDDKPGLQYSWEMLSDQRVDLEGTHSVSLRVSKLTVGVYHFRLTVTDSAGQTATSEVTVDVLPENNEPPDPDAGGPYEVHFPDTSVVLDGSGSRDDYEKGMQYCWIQTSGPSDIHLSGLNTTHLSVTNLHIDPAQGSPTTFTFNLTITDYANLSCSDTAVVTYYKDPTILPRVSAGPDVTITLPQNTAVLDGSTSWDDFGIESYQWSRSEGSPAAGIPLLESDKTPVLILSDLVNGTYNFTLRVTNKQGVMASDMMTLHVLANPNDHYIVQLHLDAPISNFSRSDLQDLGKYLSLTLKDYTIRFQGVYESPPHTVVEFYAVDTATDTFMNVSEAWQMLTENGQDYKILHYHVVQVDMKDCQFSCSGHGSCDQRTKRCHCDVFWMENPFTAHTGRHESNCEWSVFYVVLIALGVLLVSGVTIWLLCWCCLRKRHMSRTKRRIRYAIHDHNEEGESKRMLSKGQQYIELKERLGHQHTSLMQSESETEEEIFDSAKKRRSMSPSVKNNQINSERYGKNSSLVNTVIPK